MSDIPKLSPWENIKQLSSTAWENWLTVTAAIVVLLGSLGALAYPLYSWYTNKQVTAQTTLNNTLNSLSTQVNTLSLTVIAAEKDAQHAQEDTRIQAKRLDDYLQSKAK